MKSLAIFLFIAMTITTSTLWAEDGNSQDPCYECVNQPQVDYGPPFWRKPKVVESCGTTTSCFVRDARNATYIARSKRCLRNSGPVQQRALDYCGEISPSPRSCFVVTCETVEN